jgi:hypothetical protein
MFSPKMRNKLLRVFWPMTSLLAKVTWLLRRRKFSMVAMRTFLADHPKHTVIVHREPETYEIPGPRFVGEHDYEHDTTPTAYLKSPAVQIIELSDIMAMGGTNLVFSSRNAIHADVVDPTRDMFHAEVCGVAKFKSSNRSFHVKPRSRSLNVAKAISLLGECNGNYAHWLFETLPKLAILDAYEQYRNLPILVDGWIHPVFFDTISLLNAFGRRVIRVRRWEFVELQTLIYVTPTSYTAPENRAAYSSAAQLKPSEDKYVFCPPEYELLRRKAVDAARRFTQTGSLPQSLPYIFRVYSTPDAQAAVHNRKFVRDVDVDYVTPKRIYLKRVAVSAGNPRMLKSEERVESILADFGFLAIDPASVSFAEQIMLVQNVECVVAPIGAALANMIFAPPGRKVICLAPSYSNADYYYFSNMMGALGHDLRFVLGPQIDQPHVPLTQRDYIVDLKALKHSLAFLNG